MDKKKTADKNRIQTHKKKKKTDRLIKDRQLREIIEIIEIIDLCLLIYNHKN